MKMVTYSTMIERLKVISWEIAHCAASMDLRLIMIVTIIIILLIIGVFGRNWKGTQKTRSSIIVNCWFCNTDNEIKPNLENSWYCVKCEQYNGFTKDGDYNKEITAMYSYDQQSFGKEDLINNAANHCRLQFPVNGKLCESCNRMQVLKVKQLRSFIPRNEDAFDAEIEDYKNHLERRYKICNNCSEMLKRYITDQDMQIKVAYGDIKRNFNAIDSGVPKHGTEDSGRNTRRILKYLSWLWPSNLLSIVSFTSAWCLILSGITGISQESFRKCFFIGCSSRLLIWLMNPFSGRRLLLLLTWLIFFVLATMTSFVGYSIFWFRFCIVIFESWNFLWDIMKTILLYSFKRILRVKETQGRIRTAEKATHKSSSSETPRLKVNHEEKPRNVCQSEQRKIQSDGIDGRIGTMSLGLTDSEDESSQINRKKSRIGSWYASVSRFVKETDMTKSSKQSNLTAVRDKFKLQPPRLLYPDLSTTRQDDSSFSHKRDCDKAVRRSRVSEIPRKEPVRDKMPVETNDSCHTESGIHTKSSNTSGVKQTLMFIIKLLCVCAFGISVILNIYLFKTVNQKQF